MIGFGDQEGDHQGLGLAKIRLLQLGGAELAGQGTCEETRQRGVEDHGHSSIFI